MFLLGAVLGEGEGELSSATEVCRSRMRLPRKARRSLLPRRAWSKDLWVIASHCVCY